MKLTLKNAVLIPLLLVIGFISAIYLKQAYAGYATVSSPVRSERIVAYDFFASSTPGATPSVFATSTTATSTSIASWTDGNGVLDNGYLVVAGAQKVTMYFSRGGATSANTGTSTFNVEVSEDGTTWTRYKKLISNATNSNSQTLTRVETVAIEAATSTVMASFSPEDTMYAIRCVVVETIDGEHRCKALVQF